MIDISAICDPTDPRLWLRQPFNLDGKTMSTNGHLILIAPLDDRYEEVEPLHADRVRDILKQLEGVAFVSPPPIHLPETVTCGVCRGRGKAHKEECPECIGQGFAEARNDYNSYEVDCRSCRTTGELVSLDTTETCPDCFGLKTVFPDRFAGVDVAGIYLAACYVRLFADEPGLEVGQSADGEKLVFRAGDVSGLVMPRRR